MAVEEGKTLKNRETRSQSSRILTPPCQRQMSALSAHRPETSQQREKKTNENTQRKQTVTRKPEEYTNRSRIDRNNKIQQKNVFLLSQRETLISDTLKDGEENT